MAWKAPASFLSLSLIIPDSVWLKIFKSQGLSSFGTGVTSDQNLVSFIYQRKNSKK